ncbi:uncharacterized protein BP01DRAFT_18481 [Aspergillus saccharolyticus JOP 1030-1]|uniref:Uncharacterized protein n=1 Tax=Aspergillus saccharolyticus JOP 1030-1 TaxID=1450539 RepID=A0A318ZGE0_9EURO|nr:hypothetical protein BP01DRAFT_18481 [Aspergillus saccharolyticus JOP 1030-1]PYH46626.1 hypothetical protein BP01DRAFT_18481 [Aspergillus saccharolyticus JOP 1030-1]
MHHLELSVRQAAFHQPYFLLLLTPKSNPIPSLQSSHGFPPKMRWTPRRPNNSGYHKKRRTIKDRATVLVGCGVRSTATCSVWPQPRGNRAKLAVKLGDNEPNHILRT